MRNSLIFPVNFKFYVTFLEEREGRGVGSGEWGVGEWGVRSWGVRNKK
jgi:hypothetical protein